MATPNSYDQNGLLSQRRLSRAYDQPIVQHTSKGTFVRQDLDRGASADAGSSLAGENVAFFRFEAVGGILAKGALGSLTMVGALVSLLGRASLEPISQLFGFMLMLFAIFVACSVSFYWWGGASRGKVTLTVRRVLHIYALCVASDVLARLVGIFTATPPTSPIPEDTSYFISLATLLLFSFSLFVHDKSLNAMFSQETVFFVVCALVLNFSSTCLFRDILPYFMLPHLVYVGALLGLSLSLLGYRFPKFSLSGIYWALSQPYSASRQAQVSVGGVDPPSSVIRVSVDNSRSQSRKESLSSTVSSLRPRISASSMSSMNSFNPLGYDSEVSTEARGLLSDLLMNSKDALPTETQQKLRRIKDILTPRGEKGIPHASAKLHLGNKIDEDEHDYESDLSSLVSSSSATIPRHGSLLSVHNNRFPPKRGRSTSVVQIRHSSTNYAATTTTDTGMPVLESEPVERTRSQALRDVKARISIQEKRKSVHRMGRERLGSEGKIPPYRERLGSEGKLQGLRSMPRKDASSLSNTSISANESELSDTGSFTQLDAGDEDSGRQPMATPPHLHHLSSRSSEEGGFNLEVIREKPELPTTTNTNTNTAKVEEISRPRSHTLPDKVTLKFSQFEREEEEEEKKGIEREQEVGKEVSKKGKEEGERFFGQAQLGEHKFYSFTKYKRPSESCDLAEYTSNEHLDMFENVAVWDYPIFELEEKAGDHILSHMAHMLFHEAGLMTTFKIPQREFVNYFRALEANYGTNVYHNKTHAADVLHAVSYLMFEIIPEFSHEFAYEDSQREWKGYSNSKSSGGNIASAFSILEVLACYMASAMHDFDHPGRTNAFLVGTRSPLAVLYNDRSVLENHHAAASWHLLTNFQENNFLTSLEGAELKRLRFLIIEAILATDLKMHFDILSTFRAKVNSEDGVGIDWTSEMDRMLVMKMLIKMADINTPTKSIHLHRKWTERITEEFYQQSEEEETLNLPHTIFMDRRHPEKLPAVQLSFIQHLVSPLFQACAEAGIIPGIAELQSRPASSTPAPEGEEEESPSAVTQAAPGGEGAGDEAFEASGMEEIEETTSNFMSILLTNLQVNYEAWKAELPPEDQEEAEEVKEEEEDEEEEEMKLEAKTDVEEPVKEE